MKIQGKMRQIFLDHFEHYLDVAYKSQVPVEMPINETDSLLPNGKKKPRTKSNKKTKKKIIRVRPVELENVFKILFCRTGLLGYHWYKCPLGCGFELLIPHSCKSRFCSCCGHKATDDWLKTRFHYLLDCPYMHVVVTIPSSYNWMILKIDRKAGLNFYLHCATETIQEWAKDRGYTVGIVSFYHSFGGMLQLHPHFHLLVTVGGVKKDGSWQMRGTQLPAKVLMEKFKQKFVDGLKDLFESGKLKVKADKKSPEQRLNEILYRINHPWGTHWQFYVERITRSNKDTITYCVRYAKKMIMSEKRIHKYDGKTVWYECYRTVNSKKEIFVQQDDALTFIGKVVQHIPEKGFKLIRYFGIYANNKYTKPLYNQARLLWKPLDETGEKDNWRNRQWRRIGRDPLSCPNCKCELVLSKVTFPSYYLLYNWEKILAANHQVFQQRLVTCSGYLERKPVQPILL